jgi:hypothetical protein
MMQCALETREMRRDVLAARQHPWPASASHAHADCDITNKHTKSISLHRQSRSVVLDVCQYLKSRMYACCGIVPLKYRYVIQNVIPPPPLPVPLFQQDVIFARNRRNT